MPVQRMMRSVSMVVVLGCGGPPRGTGDAPVDPGSTPAWIDVHAHCSIGPRCDRTSLEECCDLTGWQRAATQHGGGAAALLSTEHLLVPLKLDPETPPEQIWLVENRNEIYATAAARDSTLQLFASLECWHDTPFDAAWATACRADVDRWIAAGARGFKDHIGKSFDAGDRDSLRWLGAWNRANGFCTVSPTSPAPNRECMAQPTVRYPALEPAWREVLAYILEERELPVVSHTISWGGDEPCFDPQTKTIGTCADVTKRHLVDLARWAAASLSPPARRRFIAAHLGFLVGAVGDPTLFVELLETGVSTETGANIYPLGNAGCDGRRAFARYADQILFGTDLSTGPACTPGTYDAWRHVITGALGDVRTFETCEGTLALGGLELGSASVPGCEHDVDPSTLQRFLRDNLLRLYPSAALQPPGR